MAVTEAGRRLSDAHRIAQSRIGARTSLRMLRIWPLLDMRDLDATAAGWIDAARPIIDADHAASAQLGDTYYRTLRRYEAPALDPDDLPVMRLTPLPANRVGTSLLVTGPISVKLGMSWEDAAAQAAGAAGRLALAGGRDAVATIANGDPSVQRVRRITSPNCCAFCAMLATRDQLPPFSGAHWFEAHDNCRCQPEPAWDDGAGQTALAKRFAEIYAEATEGVPSRGNGKINAFRRALNASRR